MNLSKILILVSTVTFLSACGGGKTGQPNMVKSQKKTSKVTRDEKGGVVFQSEQCEPIKAESFKAFCEAARDRIKADDKCKEELAINFVAENCQAEVDSSEIADYLATIKIEDDGEATIEDGKEVEVVEVNPGNKTIEVTGGEISVVAIDVDNGIQNDTPVTNVTVIQEAIDAANDVAATSNSDVDVAHVVYIPDLSDNLTQVQVTSQPSIQVTTEEKVEEKTEERKIETRIEEINDTEVQHISKRDNNLSLEEDARNKCLDLYKRICREETRGSVISRSSCERTYKRKDLKKCVASAEVRTIN